MRVPPSDVPTLQRLAGLPADAVAEIAEVLKEHSDADRSVLVRDISERAGQPEDLVSDILTTISGIEAYRRSTDLSVEEIQEALVDAERFPGKTRAERRGLAARVASLLGHRSLEVLSAAYTAIVANERTFRSVGIQTELRTVFIGPEDEPSAVVIVHDVEIAYYERLHGVARTVFFALDERDLDHLAEALASAKKRAIAVRKAFGGKGFPFASPFELSEEMSE
jgi:hypothetical protein